MTEKEALRELKKGSEEALAWFIHAYTPYVSTIIYSIIGNFMDTADLEEVASDVFFTLWQNAACVHSAKGYLGTLARNKAKNKAREAGHDLPLEDDLLLIAQQGPEEALSRKERATAVKRAVLALPQPEREIFLRFYYYYQGLEQIAGEMNLNLSTVKTKLRRGRVKLKQALTQYLT